MSHVVAQGPPIRRTDHARIEVATATGEFAQAVAELGSSDVGPQLVTSFAGLADVQRKARDAETAQSHDDMVTIMSTGTRPPEPTGPQTDA